MARDKRFLPLERRWEETFRYCDGGSNTSAMDSASLAAFKLPGKQSCPGNKLHNYDAVLKSGAKSTPQAVRNSAALLQCMVYRLHQTSPYMAGPKPFKANGKTHTDISGLQLRPIETRFSWEYCQSKQWLLNTHSCHLSDTAKVWPGNIKVAQCSGVLGECASYSDGGTTCTHSLGWGLETQGSHLLVQ